MQKKCPYCGSYKTKKKGKRNRKQRYMCHECNHHWGGKKAQLKEVLISKAYETYAMGKGRLLDVSGSLSMSPYQLRKQFDQLHSLIGEINVPDHPVATVLDATFFQEEMGYSWLELKVGT